GGGEEGGGGRGGGGVGLGIVDAPPLGCEAAARAGVPSFVVSNFTWDWIYAEYAELLPLAPDLIPTIQRAYRKARGAWRLPIHGGVGAFQAVPPCPFVPPPPPPPPSPHTLPPPPPPPPP